MKRCSEDVLECVQALRAAAHSSTTRKVTRFFIAKHQIGEGHEKAPKEKQAQLREDDEAAARLIVELALRELKKKKILRQDMWNEWVPTRPSPASAEHRAKSCVVS